MNLQRCEHGHYYDADKYRTCPHCENGGAAQNVTVPLPPVSAGGVGRYSDVTQFKQAGGSDLPPTQELGAAYAGGTASPGITYPVGGTAGPGITEPVGEGTTICLYDDEDDFSGKPVAGWLVCTAGTHKGKGFPLYPGKNFIGRNREMDVALTGEKTVSREKHAIVIYDYNSNVFLALPGESSELYYLNNEVVLKAEKLNKNDRLKISKVELMLIPCCDDAFNWWSSSEKAEDEK